MLPNSKLSTKINIQEYLEPKDVFISQPHVINYFDIHSCHFDESLFDGGNNPGENEVLTLLESEDYELYQQLRQNMCSVQSYGERMQEEMEREERALERLRLQTLARSEEANAYQTVAIRTDDVQLVVTAQSDTPQRLYDKQQFGFAAAQADTTQPNDKPREADIQSAANDLHTSTQADTAQPHDKQREADIQSAANDLHTSAETVVR